jgi:hypothetical protein
MPITEDTGMETSTSPTSQTGQWKARVTHQRPNWERLYHLW